MEANNMATMREALVAIREAMIRDSGTGPCTEFHTKVDTITQAALSTPLRNCDVGTAREQYRRFMDECSKRDCRQCSLCPYRMYLTGGRDECFAAWSQMPYESEAKG